MCVSGGGGSGPGGGGGLLIQVSVRMILVQTSERLWLLKRKGREAALRLISAGMWAEPRQDDGLCAWEGVMEGVGGVGGDGGAGAGPAQPGQAGPCQTKRAAP